MHQTVDNSEFLEEGEEEEDSAPPPKRSSVGTTTSTGRRQVYQTRRRSIPQPEPASASAAPGGPPSEPEAPDEDPSEDPSEPGEPEGEEEEEHSSDAPEAPPEGEEVEVEVEVEEEAAPSAPHAASTVLQASPKAPATRGSVSRFLSPGSTSAERSRSRHRDSPTEEEAPVAVTTSSTRVSGTIQTQIFPDGTKAEVFVPDIPRPKTPPKSIGSPPTRSASQPPKVKPPPRGVSAAKRSASAVPPWREGAARAPQEGGPPVRKKYKAPPRPPYNYSITVGQAYEPGVDPDPPQPTEEELNAAWARSKEAQDRDWDRRVESLADRKHRQALEAYHQSERQKEKHNKVKPPPKQPPIEVPPRPNRPAPKATQTASPKPTPPPSPPSTPPSPPPRPPKVSSSTASVPHRGKAGAAVRAPGGRIDLTPLIRAQQERGAIGRNLVVFFDWHDTLDCARNALKLFDQSILNKFINLVQIARGRIEFHIVSFSGSARGRQTEEDANNLSEYCRSQGLPFRSVTVVGDPVGPGGKTPVLTSHGANIHVDDRLDVCEEASRASIFTIPVYKSYNLSWWPQLENAIRDKGVDYFILNHSPVPLRGDQFSRRK